MLITSDGGQGHNYCSHLWRVIKVEIPKMLNVAQWNKRMKMKVTFVRGSCEEEFIVND